MPTTSPRLRRFPRTAGALLVLALLGSPGLAQDLASAYAERLEATMQAEASSDELEALLELYAEDVVYAHPRVGARIEGKQAVREAMSGFLGATRDATVTVTNVMRGRGVLVVQLRVDAVIVEGGAPLERDSLTVLELDAGKITRILDYW